MALPRSASRRRAAPKAAATERAAAAAGRSQACAAAAACAGRTVASQATASGAAVAEARLAWTSSRLSSLPVEWASVAWEDEASISVSRGQSRPIFETGRPLLGGSGGGRRQGGEGRREDEQRLSKQQQQQQQTGCSVRQRLEPVWPDLSLEAAARRPTW